jgi:hypothetical protein
MELDWVRKYNNGTSVFWTFPFAVKDNDSTECKPSEVPKIVLRSN